MPRSSNNDNKQDMISNNDKAKIRRVTAPDKIAEALAMREAGFTVLAISQRLGVPVRTLQRHFGEHGAVKGKVRQELLEAARADLIQRVTSDDAIRVEAAKLLADDLAHARHLRELLIAASEQLQASSLKDAALVMRAAAAYSTAIKNTSDMLRHGLRLDQLSEDSAAELPELVISELTPEQVSKLRDAQRTEEMLH